MFIDQNKIRVNIYAPWVDKDGNRYPNMLNKDVRDALKITEIPDPVPPEDYDEALYFRVEQDTEPYVVYTRRSTESILDTMQARYLQLVQNHLDAGAQAQGYDNIVSACSYAGAPNPFQDEGISFIAWRGAVWAYCYDVLAQVRTGSRPLPTAEELLAELPTRS
jgi:hypothetical protein